MGNHKRRILDVVIQILEKEETVKLPDNVVKYTIITENKYLDEYLRPYVNVNFSKKRLLILFLDPFRYKIKSDIMFGIILKISGITKEQLLMKRGKVK